MKNQYIRLFSFLFGLTFIISGVIFTFTKVYKDAKAKEKEEETVIVEEIDKTYDEFEKKYNEINSFRDKFIDELAENTSFYTNLADSYDDLMKEFESYETQINELDEMSSYLKENCKKRYSAASANKSCNNYYIYLEKTTNLFIGDVKFFSKKVEDYNEWIVEENKSEFIKVKYKELEEYKSSKYTKYVDLNKDDTYLGMNAD